MEANPWKRVLQAETEFYAEILFTKNKNKVPLFND